MTPNFPLPVSTKIRPFLPVHNFVGRQTEINLLSEVLQSKNDVSSGNVALIYGESGIGKTELALVVAHRLRHKFSDGELLIRLSGQHPHRQTVQQILETIIHTVDPFVHLPDNMKELQALYYSLLVGKRCFILIDQIDSEDELTRLIPPPTCALLLTSLYEISVPGVFALYLDKLAPLDAERLLLSICPRINQHKLELARLSNYAPLSLRLSATLLERNHSFDIASYIQALLDQTNKSRHEGAGPTIGTFIQQNYEQLDARAQRAYCQLSVLSDSFNRDEALAIVRFADTNAISEETLQHCLDMLVQMSLLTFDNANKLYRMHDETCAFARERLNNSVDIYFRLAQHYVDIAEDCEALARLGSDGVLLSLMTFDDYKAHFKLIWSWLQQGDKRSTYVDTFIVKLCKIPALYKRQRFMPTLELIPMLMGGLEAARRLEDWDAESWLLGELGTTF